MEKERWIKRNRRFIWLIGLIPAICMGIFGLVGWTLYCFIKEDIELKQLNQDKNMFLSGNSKTKNIRRNKESYTVERNDKNKIEYNQKDEDVFIIYDVRNHWR